MSRKKSDTVQQSSDFPIEELQSSIGFLVLIATLLESVLIAVIRKCTTAATLTEIHCLVGGDSFESLTDKLDKLLKHICRDETEFLKQWKPIRKKLDRFNLKRNEYIHSHYTGTPPFERRKFKRRFITSIEDLRKKYPISPSEIMEIAQNGVSLGDSVIDFFNSNDKLILAATKRRSDEFKVGEIE